MIAKIAACFSPEYDYNLFHFNNSEEGWGVKASFARFHTPTPLFFEKLQ